MLFLLCAAYLAIPVLTRRLNAAIDQLQIRAHTEGLTGEVIEGEYGRYQLGEKKGSGAFGTVYLASEQQTGRKVVAKVIDIRTEEPHTSFLTERRIWKHMQSCPGYPHPNVIQHIEVLQLPGKKGVVMMELAGGGPLSDTLYMNVSAESALSGRRTKLGDALLTDEALAKRLFGQLAAGAQWLGKCGVVHKDLKPDNIMLTKPFLKGGIIKIIDFGLAMLTSDQRAGGLANMLYSLHSTVDPRTNKKGTRTFDDFSLGSILAEIGTGVPPYFNPDYDYYSRKEGNLQKEKGIFYILQPNKICEKGDEKIHEAKTDLADGKVSIKMAVKEVVGRSLYYIQNGRHFIYRSALEQGVGNVQLLTRSWLYNSPAAMSLLYSLMAGRQDERIEPSTLMSAEWFSDVQESGEDEEIEAPPAKTAQDMEPAPSTPIISEDVNRFSPEPPMQEAFAPEEDKFEPEVETVEEAPKLNMCKHAYKEPGPRNICRVRHLSREDCYAEISCRGGPSQMVKIEQGGFGGFTYENCYNCKVG